MLYDDPELTAPYIFFFKNVRVGRYTLNYERVQKIVHLIIFGVINKKKSFFIISSAKVYLYFLWWAPYLPFKLMCKIAGLRNWNKKQQFFFFCRRHRKYCCCILFFRVGAASHVSLKKETHSFFFTYCGLLGWFQNPDNIKKH